jgi:hypothetical protein
MDFADKGFRPTVVVADDIVESFDSLMDEEFKSQRSHSSSSPRRGHK